MALARLLMIITLSYLQEISGQSNTLLNNAIERQNNINQGFLSSSTIKNIKDTFFQNENYANPVFASASQPNTMQPQLQPTFSLQQNLPQTVNQQSPQIQQPELQSQILYQAQTSNLPPPGQQASLAQQPYSFIDGQPAFVPVEFQPTIDFQQLNPYQYANAGITNLQQQTPLTNPSLQQALQSLPIPNSFVAAYSMPVALNGDQRNEIVTNLSGNYLVPMNAIPFHMPDGQLLTSVPSLPYKAIIATSPKPAFGNNLVIPYQNPNFGVYKRPVDNFSILDLDDEEPYLDYDNLTSLLMSLLQPPKRSSKNTQTSYQENFFGPYGVPYKVNQGSKSSSLKALLPIIFSLIKDKREEYRCGHDCECKRKINKDIEPQIIEGYSKRRDYSMREEMFRLDSEEDVPRFTKEHKKNKKKNKPLPKVIIESIENDADYDNFSNED